MESQIVTNGQIEKSQVSENVIKAKREAWAKHGEIIYRSELQLQLRAQQALQKLAVLPATIEDVANAEVILKDVKKDRDSIEADRKAITSKFDPVFERLMAPEKSFALPVQAYTNAIIGIKKQHEEKQRQVNLKTQELAGIRQKVLIAASQADANLKALIAEKVNECYRQALSNNIQPGLECEDYMDRKNFEVKESYFIVQPPKYSPIYTTQEEVDAIMKENFKLNPADYVVLFTIELEKRFSDYEVAFKNKQQALESAKKQGQERLASIQQEQQQREVSATLDAMASEPNIEVSTVKALKKSYEVDIVAMGETPQTVIKIFAAFSANLQQCLTKLKVNKWMAFTPLQAATALGKLKSDDNAFAPSGLIFKEVDKL